ncbi:hypothetical protein SRABI106_02796 [Rahnella aquatilis]|nr:hypothetical protein SRABI106_02796 [Rahnella aquatilis]
MLAVRAGLLHIKCGDHQRVHHRAANHHGHKRFTAEFFTGGITDHQREEIKHSVAGGEPDFIGTAFRHHPATGQRQCQKTFEDPRCRHNADKRRENAGDDIYRTGKHTAVITPVVIAAVRKRAAFHQRFIDGTDVITNHHLKLTTALDHHDHARIFFQPGSIGFAGIF